MQCCSCIFLCKAEWRLKGQRLIACFRAQTQTIRVFDDLKHLVVQVSWTEDLLSNRRNVWTKPLRSWCNTWKIWRGRTRKTTQSWWSLRNWPTRTQIDVMAPLENLEVKTTRSAIIMWCSCFKPLFFVELISFQIHSLNFIFFKFPNQMSNINAVMLEGNWCYVHWYCFTFMFFVKMMESHGRPDQCPSPWEK